MMSSEAVRAPLRKRSKIFFSERQSNFIRICNSCPSGKCHFLGRCALPSNFFFFFPLSSLRLSRICRTVMMLFHRVDMFRLPWWIRMRSQFLLLYISSQVLFDGRAAQLNKFRFSARWQKYRSKHIQSFCGKNTKCFQTPWEREIIIIKRCWYLRSFNPFFFVERIITPITIYDPFTVKL